jgi:hypothetical protein
MQIQNQYFQVLSNYDHRTHYLRIDENDQLMSLAKSNLSLWQRFTRLFWKPENERIYFVANKIFETMTHEFTQNNSIALKDVFWELEYLAIKSEYKNKHRVFLEKFQSIQKRIFLNLHKNELDLSRFQMQRKMDQEQEEFKRQMANAQSSLASVLASSAQVSSELQSKEKERVALHETKRNIEIEANACAESLAIEKGKFECLKAKKKWLESDTVLWTDDGFVFCNSACFSKDSLLNLSSQDKMSQVSPQVNERMEKAKQQNPELASTLQSMKRHIYLENTSIKYVNMAIALLAKGSIRGKQYLNDDLAAMSKLADYLLEPSLSNLLLKIASAKKEPKAPAPQIPHVQLQPVSFTDVFVLKNLQKRARGFLSAEYLRKNYLSEDMHNFLTKFIHTRVG